MFVIVNWKSKLNSEFQYLSDANLYDKQYSMMSYDIHIQTSFQKRWDVMSNLNKTSKQSFKREPLTDNGSNMYFFSLTQNQHSLCQKTLSLLSLYGFKLSTCWKWLANHNLFLFFIFVASSFFGIGIVRYNYFYMEHV